MGRLQGQDVSIRFVKSGTVIGEVTAIGSMNSTVDIEIKQDAFLGEATDRFDNVVHGYSGDAEFQLEGAAWVAMQESVIARADRSEPDLVFNVIETEIHPNGDTVITTFMDVAFGAQAKSVASRGDFVKIKLDWKCSQRPVKVNSLP